MNLRVVLFCVSFSLLLASFSRAQVEQLPDSEWSEEVKLLTAQAMLAEAGFQSRADHVAIAYVLARRYRLVKHSYSFAKMLRAYCSGFDKWVPKRLERRLTWIKSLSAQQEVAPTGWPPEYGSWERHRKLWNDLLQRAEDWRAGRLADPCKGRAIYWGGVGDPRLGHGLVTLNCGKTDNTFYGYKQNK
jgi:hypothetical protein